MATTKNRWFSDLVGTMRDFRIGFTGVRLKNVAGALSLRNAADTLDASIKLSALQMTNSPGVGKIMRSDASGNGTWEAVPVASDAVLQKNILMFMTNATGLGGSSLVGINASNRFNHYVYQTVQFAVQRHIFVCAAGTYVLKILAIKGASMGIVEARIDGVLVSTIDLYAASASWDNLLAFSNVTLVAGAHTLDLTTTTKNASSSGYTVGITYASLVTGQ
jgi:hypothetical protein